MGEKQTIFRNNETKLETNLKSLEEATIHYSTVKEVEVEKIANEKEVKNIIDELMGLSEEKITSLIKENETLLTESKNEKALLEKAISEGVRNRIDAMVENENFNLSLNQLRKEYEEFSWAIDVSIVIGV